jgi:hypothetical protein
MVSPSFKMKYPNAVFGMLTMEQPLYAPVLQNYDYLKKNFELMITYSLDSTYPGTTIANLPITYYPSHIVPIDRVLEPGKSYKEKTGFNTGNVQCVCWFFALYVFFSSQVLKLFCLLQIVRMLVQKVDINILKSL